MRCPRRRAMVLHRNSADSTDTEPLRDAASGRCTIASRGANDPRVPQSEAEQIVKAVRANGVPVWYLLGKDEGHGFAKKPNQDYQFFQTVQFWEQFLFKQ